LYMRAWAPPVPVGGGKREGKKTWRRGCGGGGSKCALGVGKKKIKKSDYQEERGCGEGKSATPPPSLRNGGKGRKGKKQKSVVWHMWEGGKVE